MHSEEGITQTLLTRNRLSNLLADWEVLPTEGAQLQWESLKVMQQIIVTIMLRLFFFFI